MNLRIAGWSGGSGNGLRRFGSRANASKKRSWIYLRSSESFAQSISPRKRAASRPSLPYMNSAGITPLQVGSAASMIFCEPASRIRYARPRSRYPWRRRSAAGSASGSSAEIVTSRKPRPEHLAKSRNRGSSSRQGSHHVAQKLTSVTWPRLAWSIRWYPAASSGRSRPQTGRAHSISRAAERQITVQRGGAA